MLNTPSTTIQVTVVTPTGKVAGALFETEATQQLSSVTGVPRTIGSPTLAVTFAGQVIVGSSVSIT